MLAVVAIVVSITCTERRHRGDYMRSMNYQMKINMWSSNIVLPKQQKPKKNRLAKCYDEFKAAAWRK